MIYIDKTEHPYFQSLAKLISFHLAEPNEVTSDYSKKGLWMLNYWSQLYKSVDKIVENGSTYIAVQTELLQIKGHDAYMEFLKNAVQVWDYTYNFKIGYSDFFRMEMENAKDIDILFFGKINDMRNEVLKKIPNVTIITDIYSPEIFKYVMRSKIVLSLMFYEKSNADWTRLAPLLSNNAFVIAEKCYDIRFNLLTEFIIIADRQQIPELCEYYLNNPLLRIKWSDKGFNYLKNERNTSF